MTLGTNLHHTLVLVAGSGEFATTNRFTPPLVEQHEEVLVSLATQDERAYPVSHALTLETDDAALYRRVQAWSRAGASVRALIAGADRHVVWNEPATPRIVPRGDLTPGAHLRRIRFFSAHPGASVAEGVENLLALPAPAYAWHGAAALPSAYATGGPATETWDGAALRLDVPGAGADATVEVAQFMPLPGRTVLALWPIPATDYNVFAPPFALVVEALDYTGSVIGSTSVSGGITSGYLAAEYELPALTVEVRMRFEAAPNGAAKYVTLGQPVLLPSVPETYPGGEVPY